jgi:large subunit ribosomal protein L11
MVSSKIITKKIKIIIESQNATMSPPVGPILGQLGIKIKQFCDDFNNNTLQYPNKSPLSVSLTVYKDSTYSYKVYSPSISSFFNQFLKTIPLALLIYKISLIKHHDMPYLKKKSIYKNVIATYYARTN